MPVYALAVYMSAGMSLSHQQAHLQGVLNGLQFLSFLCHKVTQVCLYLHRGTCQTSNLVSKCIQSLYTACTA